MEETYIIDDILGNLNDENWEEIRQNGINFIYPSGMTALGLAVYYDREENVHFLLEKGADPNIYGEEANSPLMDAFYSFSPRLMILLLMYGADPALGKLDGSGSSPKQVLREIGAGEFFAGLFCQYVPRR